jgi:hypothetical protein
MDRQILLSVLGAAILGFIAILLLMPDSADDGVDRLPWQITQDQTGRTVVFGFTLGQTTLAEVRRVLQEDGELNLFNNPGEAAQFSVEAFFEQIELKRLRADFVMTLDVDQATLSTIYDRGLRISQASSGAKKVKLDPADAEILASKPIRNISYLPKVRLDDALIEQRFGLPEQRLTEPKTGVLHWLYPKRGIDIGRDANGHAVIQYVGHAEFNAVLEPLRQADTATKSDAALSN